MRNRRSDQRVIAAAVMVCALTLVSCGSSGKSSSTAASLSPRLQFDNCMRSHGVPSFPDGPNIPGAVEDSPAFKSAGQACIKKYLWHGDGPQEVSKSARERLLRQAACMREHGVPDYPDPTFPSHGPPNTALPPDVNTSSPAFTHAANACGSP